MNADSKRAEVLAKASQRELIEEYYQNGRMLLNLATATGRLVLAGREMTRLAGFTARVTELANVLDDLSQGYYVRTMVSTDTGNGSAASAAAAGVGPGATADSAAASAAAAAENGEASKTAANGAPASSAALATAIPAGANGTAARAHPHGSGTTRAARVRVPLKASGAQVHLVDQLIRFEGVPLITPNGDVLVNALDIEVRAGMNVLVAGPNGCGKSSLFRVLGGLWPQFGGTLYRPPQDKIFFIPQRPYLTLGTLRDQIIYPHSETDMRAAGVSDADLLRLLDDVALGSLALRPGGLDAVCDWADVLSGGEKQRVAMSRVFYHKPQVAILDECTSAVSVDIEALLYTRCREMGITLFTVSHRKSLWRFHEYLLRFDGRGHYEFRAMTPDDVANAFGS